MAITGGSSFDTTILNSYLYLPGRAGGQILGANAHASGALYDFAIEGRLQLGDNLGTAAFVAGRVLNIAQLCRNATSQMSIAYSATGFTGTASGTWRGLQLTLTGTAGYTLGSMNIVQGFFFTCTMQIPSGVGINTLMGGIFQATPAETNSAVATGVNNIYGLQVQALGTATPNTLHNCTKLTGIYSEISTRLKPTLKVMGYELHPNSGFGGATTDLIFFGTSGANWLATAIVTTTYGLKLDMGTSATANFTKRYGLWVDEWFAMNILAQPTCIGAQQDPIHTVDIQGNLGLTVSAVKTAAYAPNLETVIPCDANAIGAFAINLPTAVGISGRVYIIKKVDASANAVTVTPNGAETIDGAATVVLNVQWQVVRIISDGANWLVI